MKDENNDTPQAPSSRKLVKRLSIAGGAVFLLIIIGYLSVTSGAFVKSVVLPKLSKALNAEVTVTDASVGLFSGVSMKGLRVVSAETDLVKAGEATLRYSFWALASGRIEVSEFTLDAPEVFLVQNPDGTSNLTPILEALNSEDADKKKEATASTSGAPEVDLRNIVLKNAKLRFESYSTNGVEVVEASPVAINVDHVGNGIDGELKLSTGVTFERGPKLDEPVDAIYAEMNAAFSFGLDANLLPKGLKGNSTITVNSAKGAFANADKLVASLNLDLDLTTIRDLSLDVKRGEQLLSSVKLSGPFNAETLDADLDLQLSGIDRNILSLVTAPLMIDLGDTAINSQNQLQLREQGTQFSLKGELKIDKLSVKKDALTTPVVDGAFRYQAGVDLNSSSAKLEAFDLGVTQAGRQLIGSSLTKPLSITWAGEPGVTGDSELQLKIDNLNLAEWAAVAGEYVSAGTVNAEWKLEASNGGKDVTISGNEALQGLRVKIGTNWVDQINVSAFLNASVTNQNAGSLKVFEVRTDRAGREIAAIAAN
ncbi:MAG: AsmA family protein, partial [Verrucomicrobiia bacterium]